MQLEVRLSLLRRGNDQAMQAGERPNLYFGCQRRLNGGREGHLSAVPEGDEYVCNL